MATIYGIVIENHPCGQLHVDDHGKYNWFSELKFMLKKQTKTLINGILGNKFIQLYVWP